MVKIYQNIDNTPIAQQFDPVIEKRPAVYFDKTLRDRICDGAQARTKACGKKQCAQLSRLYAFAGEVVFHQTSS